MDISMEREGNAIGSLFQQIIADLKNTSPLWEDFVAKANKLYACLRTAIQAIAAYLDAFQKIADAATNSKGASKEIGTALTRVCLRQKAVETRMKTFTSAIMDCLILPLQDKIEDWKRQVGTLDKDHAKEYKRCRAELKKRSQDTLRLQKKARKSSTGSGHHSSVLAGSMNAEKSIKNLVETSMLDVTQRRNELEEVERKSLRAAMIEERVRYSTFVNLLQPVVKEEYEVMYELGHLQEAMQTVTNVTRDPGVLPAASEELISEMKTPTNYLYPESPSHCATQQLQQAAALNNGGSGNLQGCSNSLGSRKSSVCSISSMNSSGSGGGGSIGMSNSSCSNNNNNGAIGATVTAAGSTASSTSSSGQHHHHHHFQRSLSQLISPVMRLKPGESSDSGFCSSPALTTQASQGASNMSHAVSTWPPHIPDGPATTDRPHTISSAYEKGHQRPALTVYTFQSPEATVPANPNAVVATAGATPSPPVLGMTPPGGSLLSSSSLESNAHKSSTTSLASRPPIPVRCSSLERPASTVSSTKNNNVNTNNISTLSRQSPSPLPAHITKEHQQLQPTYVNMSELANMAAMKMNASCSSNNNNNNGPSQQPPQLNSPVLSTASSLISTDSSATATHQSSPDVSMSAATTTSTATPVNSAPDTNHNSPSTPVVSHDYDSGYSMDSKTISPENDYKCAGSVSEKASLFEKLEMKKPQMGAAASTSSASATLSMINRSESLYGRRNEEIYKACGTLDSDKIEADSIQELNDLIGELDLFQREHELSTLLAKCQNASNSCNTSNHSINSSSSNFNPSLSNNTSRPSAVLMPDNECHSTDELDAVNGGRAAESTSASDEVLHNGFENPSFRYLNNNNNNNLNNANEMMVMASDMNNSQEIILIRDDQMSGDTQKYLQENSEIVTLRCKEVQPKEKNCTSIGIGGMGNDNLIRGSNNNNMNDIGQSRTNNAQQRMSSFKQDGGGGGSGGPAAVMNGRSSLNALPTQTGLATLKRTHSQNYSAMGGDKLSPSIPVYCQVPNAMPNGGGGGNYYHHPANDGGAAALSAMDPTQIVLVSPDGKARNKPIVSPRPASLSGGSRLARRSSVNTTKPPPPVRRSSSVTPSPQMSSPLNQSQQNLMTASSESLPPPPAYLLDTHHHQHHHQHQQQQQQHHSTNQNVVNVADTVKALTDLRHTPASPGVLRRAQMLLQQQQQQHQLQQTGSPQNAFSQAPNYDYFATQPALLVHNNPNTHMNGGPYEPSTAGPAVLQMHDCNVTLATTTSIVYNQSYLLNSDGSGGCNNTASLNNMNNSSFDNDNMSNAFVSSQQQLPPPPPQHELDEQRRLCASPLLQPTAATASLTTYNKGHTIIDSNSPDAEATYETNYRATAVGAASPNHGIYAQPKHSKMLSFRNQSSGVPSKGQPSAPQSSSPSSTSLIAQLSARLTPTKTQQQQQQQQQSHNERYNEAKLYAQQLQQQQQQQQHQNQNQQPLYEATVRPQDNQQQQHQQTYENSCMPLTTTATAASAAAGTPSAMAHSQASTTSASLPTLPPQSSAPAPAANNGHSRGLTKTSVGFLENLNAKIAEQRLSGKAYAVRSLINSKALPDPRVCHESLMDQIRRGASLRRNKTINDKSAPKIH